MYNRGFNARTGGVHENHLQTFKTFQEEENQTNLSKQSDRSLSQAAGSSDKQNRQKTDMTLCLHNHKT